MKRVRNGATEPVMTERATDRPVMKRVRNGATEPVMTEREMDPVTDRETDRVMDLVERVTDRVMEPMMRVMEPMMQVMQEIKRLIETLSKQSAPADCNLNPRTSLDQAETSEGRGYQLLFADKLPSIIFTDSKIEAEISGPVKIELIDTISKATVTSGPLSSIKIQILALDGDFGFEAQENWAEQDFNDKVVHEREGKRPLVTGELNIMLRDGVGFTSDLSFTDNSSWIKCRKFRLGARVVQSIGGQERIKEAISEAFVVKDRRTKMYGKHHPPSLDDKVWRLEKIRKDGKFHRLLASHQIDTVKDFMRMYVTDPTKLREMLDCPEGAWNTIVEHASTCVVNDEISFTYSVDGIGLQFNSVYKLVAAAIDGQNYQSVDDPTFTHKPFVKSIKEQAYRNVSSFVPIDGRDIFGPSKSLPILQDEPISSSTTGLQHPEFPVTDQGLAEMQIDCNHATNSSPSTGGLGNHSHQLPLPIPQTFDYNLGMVEFFSPSNDEIVPNIASSSQAPMSTWTPVNATWEHNGFYLTSTINDSEFGHIANTHGMQVVHGRDGKGPRVTGELRKMLDCPEGAWDKILEQTSTCDVSDGIFFTYFVDGIGLQFNSVYKLVAAAIDGQNYQSVDDPTFTHKPLVETLKKQAYRNVNSFVQVDRHAIFGPSNPLISLQAEPGLQHPEFPVAHAGSSEIQSGFDHASPSTSYNYGPEDHTQQSHFSVAENTQPIQAFDPMCSRNYSFKWTDHFEEIIPNLASEVMSQAPISTWSPVHSNGIIYTSTSGDSELGFLAPLQNFSGQNSKKGKNKAAWCTIRAVLKMNSARTVLCRQKNGCSTRVFDIIEITPHV